MGATSRHVPRHRCCIRALMSDGTDSTIPFRGHQPQAWSLLTSANAEFAGMDVGERRLSYCPVEGQEREGTMT